MKFSGLFTKIQNCYFTHTILGVQQSAGHHMSDSNTPQSGLFTMKSARGFF